MSWWPRIARETDWRTFFNGNRLVPIQSHDDLLYQVGYTVGGKPIGAEQFRDLCDDIRAGLAPTREDDLLDLCCGNGLISFELAGETRRVTGVDVSVPYIENARRFKSAPNIEYHLGDATNLAAVLDRGLRFSKCVFYGSIAYFSPDEFETILKSLRLFMPSGGLLFVGSILDADRKWRFYNTFRRRVEYIWGTLILGRDPGVGKWWSRRELIEICRGQGLTCEFRNSSPSLHTAHYRFDAVIGFTK